MSLKSIVHDAAMASNSSRIRQIDLIRALSIWVVVLAHAFMGVVTWQPVLVVDNLLSLIPPLQWISWVLQVMPLFFIAGAAANAISYESAVQKQIGFNVWVYKRISRLLAPVFWYLIFMVGIGYSLNAVLPPAQLEIFFSLSTQLLWFLGIYILMTTATPLWIKLNQNFLLSILIGIALISIVDQLRMSSAPIGLLNFVVGWGVISLIGVRFVKEINQPTFAKSHIWLIGAATLTLELLLVFFKVYPISLVGLPNASFSNMAPPSLLLVLHGIFLATVWLSLQRQIELACRKPQIWRFAIRSNLTAMTIYLWHLPILMLIHTILNRINWRILSDSADVFTLNYWPKLTLVILLTISLITIWSSKFYVFENLLPKSPKTLLIPLANSAWISAVGAATAAVSLLMFSVVGAMDFPNRLGGFAGIQWSNGFTALLLALSMFLIWLGAKVQSTPATKSE